MSDDTIAINIEQWTQTNAEFTNEAAERSWDDPVLKWGVFGIPETDVGCLGEVAGLDVVELGCGTAFTSARLARLGARPVGVDPTPAQLDTARRMQERTGIVFPLVEAPGESVPLPAASFDLALSDYGASLWADPYEWIPEAARLLRPGGRLVFLTNSQLAHLTVPEEDVTPDNTLQRDLFGMWRTKWPNYPGIEYHLSHGEWIRVLRANGFAIDALHELRPEDDAVDHTYYYAHPVEWARRWPAEEIWEAHLQ
jgi:SAM-dependent methyltransferase